MPGLADTPYWTNRDAVQVTDLPASLIVVGGGPIAAEMTQVFARFGVQVTLLQRGQRILPRLEPEAGALVQDVFVHEGIRVLTGVETTSVAYAEGRFTVTLDDGTELGADKLLVAAGRTPNLDDVGLETVGLDPTARTVEVDARLRAGEKLWAIGDITGKGAFTHVAMYQAAHALADILEQDGHEPTYHALPHVTFTDPEAAAVGMTEQEARDAGLSVRVGLDRAGDVVARLAARSRRPRTDQGGRGRRPRGPRGRHRRRPLGRRDPRLPGRRGARSGAGGHAAQHDLRLPDLPPRDRDGAAPTWGEPCPAQPGGPTETRAEVAASTPRASTTSAATARPTRGARPRRTRWSRARTPTSRSELEAEQQPVAGAEHRREPPGEGDDLDGTADHEHRRR